MESKETLLKNLKIDLSDIIQTEIHRFVRREPEQVKNVDWNDENTSYRFARGSILAADKIMDHLKSNDLLKE
jgi:hypothetical protein